MQIMYVDESGDDGFSPGSSSIFLRTGLILHDRKWRSINKAVDNLKNQKRIPKTEELHAADIYRGRSRIYISGKQINKRNWYGLNYSNQPDRIEILKEFCRLIEQNSLTLICVCINKGKIDQNRSNYRELVRNKSWELLIERYNKYLNDAKDKKGIIISDAIQNKIEHQYREFARNLYNQSTHIDEFHFIESILFEPSDSSNLLQLTDIASYAFFRKDNVKDDRFFNELKDALMKREDGSIKGVGYKCWPS